MKFLFSSIIMFVFIVSIISCSDANREINQAEQTEIFQTNKIETNEVYINPTITNDTINKNKTQITNEYLQGTEMDPIPTGYSKIDEILNKYQYKMMIYEISELISEKGINGTLDDSIQKEGSYTILAHKNSTPLFLAVQYGYNDLAKELIKENADVNARVDDMETEDGMDMLYYAVDNNNAEMTELLIDKGLDAGREYGYEYPYYLTDLAIKNNNLDILKILVESKDINLQSSLIPDAVEENNIEMVEYLISIGQDVNAQIFADGFWINSPMKVAAQNGNIEIAKLLIDKGANLNSSDDYIYNAIDYGNYDVAKLLIDNDVFNLNTNTTKEQALTLAKDRKYYEIEKLLSSEDSNNIDLYDDIMNAVSKGDIKELEKLIKDDTDLNKQYDKITPLSLAAARNDTNMIKLLVQKGANINLEDGYGYSPIMKALFYNNRNAVYAIADLNADLNTICKANGETPLTYLAPEIWSAKLCNYLIQKKADVNKQNDEGYTPLMKAAQNGFPSVMGVFIHAGADYNIKNNEGKTVFDIIEEEDKSPVYIETLKNPESLQYYLNTKY